MKSIFSIL